MKTNYDEDWEFCLFLPLLGKKNNFGILVLTNQYINENNRRFIRSFISKKRFNAYSSDCEIKEAVLASVLCNLIETKLTSDLNNGIIDLRNRKENFLKSFTLNSFKINSLKPTDLSIINKLVNETSYQEWFLDLDVTVFVKNLFSKFENITSLELLFNVPCTLEPFCFNGLKNLKRLRFCNFHTEIINENVFCDLNNLKNICFTESKIQTLGSKAFKNLNNIESLSFISVVIESIDSSCFDDLVSLIHLNLTFNNIQYLPDHTFDKLANLTVLNLTDALKTPIDANNFNNLVNLEFLSFLHSDKTEKILNLGNLKLPNLKFLVINSKKIPDFDLNLDFLVINGLEEYDENMFLRLNDLKCLIIRTNGIFLKNFKKEIFKKMKKLVFLMFIFEDLDEKNYEFIEKNREYFKEFLNQSEPKIDLDGYMCCRLRISCYDKMSSLI
ncbi:unnamed protein product [Brachionus calyciflorus]|uniref:Uncharacterized protein n=1 Tax=Brachionus calyciflorus TaxID=104777 RepID=A0A814DPT0_9BILA|nr:unnamed protein product [Brachionus calyciflorus]